MMGSDIQNEVRSLLTKYGYDRIKEELEKLLRTDEKPDVCTILINKGLHNFPTHLFVGETYVFYRGSVDFTSEQNLERMMAERLRELRLFLQGRKWKQVYIVVSGHAAVCMQVKLAVYRVTHIETIDWVFDGAGNYLKLELPLRELLAGD